MKLSQITALWALPSLSYGWKRLTLSAKATSIINDLQPISTSLLELNPSQVLESARQKPGFYAAAMLEIKRLEEKPLCHRMAAQLLVKNCQGLKDLDVHEYQLASESMQRHHVESFAASLAMCDMERARFDIPETCRPFRSHALHSALRGTGKLDVSPNDVSHCLQGLGQDHSHWSTWLSYRDTSLLLCRGASIDVDKDQAIKLQKQFVQMMEEFTTQLYDDLRDLRRQMASHVQGSKTHYEELDKQAESFRAKVHETFGSVSEDIQNANLGVKSIVDGTKDANRMIRNLVNTMVQSNAEMAAEQEHAITTSTTNLQSSLGAINVLISDNKERLGKMQDVMELLTTSMSVLVERQNAIEESSQITLHALINATELVQSNQEKLNAASEKAFQISETLDKVTTMARLFSSSNGRSTLVSLVFSYVLDWMLRTVFPIIFLVIDGNFKTVAAMPHNIALAVMGYLAGETINVIRHADWVWIGCEISRCRSHSSSEQEESFTPSTEEPGEATWRSRFVMPKPTTLLTITTDSAIDSEHHEMG